MLCPEKQEFEKLLRTEEHEIISESAELWSIITTGFSQTLLCLEEYVMIQACCFLGAGAGVFVTSSHSLHSDTHSPPLCPYSKSGFLESYQWVTAFHTAEEEQRQKEERRSVLPNTADVQPRTFGVKWFRSFGQVFIFLLFSWTQCCRNWRKTR